MGHARQYREIALQAIHTLTAVGMMLDDGRGPVLVRSASGLAGRLAEVDREREREATRADADAPSDAEAPREAAGRADDARRSAPKGWKAQDERKFEAKKRAERKQAEAAEEPAGEAAVEILGRNFKPAPPEHEPELRGHSPRGTKARQFRLIGIDDAGERTGFEDVGTAAELAERNHIGPSTIYKGANSGRPAGKYLIEKVG